MNLRARTALGALVLCALALSAFGAATATAAGGLTAVECVKKGAGHEFESSHCLTNGNKGEYETVAIKPGVKKEVEGIGTREISETEHGLGNTANPVIIIHYVGGGFASTLTCGKDVITGGKIENVAGPPMKIRITEWQSQLEECHASTETNPTKICSVQGTAPETAVGEIKTNKLVSETGPEHSVRISPEAGEAAAFTEFKILASGGECFTKVALAVKVTGEATGTANTKTHSHLTFKEPWKCGGQGQPACGGLKANNNNSALTETVTGFTKGNKEATVGTTTESEIKETEE